jgi:hypothetical protein
MTFLPTTSEPTKMSLFTPAIKQSKMITPQPSIPSSYVFMRYH